MISGKRKKSVFFRLCFLMLDLPNLKFLEVPCSIFIISFFLQAALPAQVAAGLKQDSFPRISVLQTGDLVFRQLQDSIAQGYKAENNSGSWPDLFICIYAARKGDDLFGMAARLGLPYEALATLNGINKPREFKTGEIVFVPSFHGLFIADKTRNDMDILLANRNAESGSAEMPFSMGQGKTEQKFVFLAGKRFNSTERAFFLSAGFRLPLAGARISSSYGMRQSPIDGNLRKHQGVDLAAPLGTEVIAARAGIVSESGWDDILGNYLILDHGGGIKTVYGHVLRILVVLNQSVLSGTIIAAVGSTGSSTGPHLHFEIRLDGTTRDPAGYLPGLSQ